jgi:ABC-type lipoprotein release transport system permease subunit
MVPGAVLSVFSVRIASHLLYGSVSANSLAIIAASLVLALAGSAATLIPARRAALTDPAGTLRSE